MRAIAHSLGGLLALASWLAPNHYLPWLSFHAELLMGLAGLFVLVSELAGRPRVQQVLSPLMTVVLIASCVPLAQAAFGLIRFAGDAWLVFEYLLAFALAQMLGQMLAGRVGLDALFEGMSKVFVAAGVACVYLQLIQWLGLPGLGIFSIELPPGHAPFANVAQPNHLASMLFLSVMSGLFLFERGRVGGLASAMLYLVLAFGLVMTGSRTAWLTMALTVLGLWLASANSGLRIGRAGVLSAGLLFVALLVLWAPLNDILILSPGRTFATQSQAGPRPLLWATMASAILLQPWFGYGWGQGLVAQGRVIGEHPAGGRLMENSHNLVMDLMVWNGVPLALVLCAVLAAWFWRQMRADKSAAQIAMLAGVTAFFVHAMLEFPLSYAYLLLPAGVMMGGLDAAVPSRFALRWPRAFTWVLTALAGILLGAIVYEYSEVESNTRTLQLELARVGTHEIVSKAPELTLLTQWNAYLHFARVEPRPGLTQEQLAWMGRVVERFPYAGSQFNVAAANALNGHYDSAGAMLAHMCQLHTRQTCLVQLREWRVLAREYPQLAQVSLPEVPIR
jgi:O-antigen ligase